MRAETTAAAAAAVVALVGAPESLLTLFQ